jgi:arylsulfatase A
LDGRSFLPQLKGKKGKPREAIFLHYWERGRVREKAREMARNERYALFNNGDFFDLQTDIDQARPMDLNSLSRNEKRIHKLLEKELIKSGSL